MSHFPNNPFNGYSNNLDHSHEAAPAYSCQPGSGEALITSAQTVIRHDMPSHYEYNSKRLTLNLGPRGSGGTQTPSYGAGGVIEGFVIIHSLSHAEKVELTVSKYLLLFKATWDQCILSCLIIS